MPSAIPVTEDEMAQDAAGSTVELEQEEVDNGYTTQHPVMPAENKLAGRANGTHSGHKAREKKKKATKSGAPAAVKATGFQCPATSYAGTSSASSVNSPMQFPKAATPLTGSPLVRPSSLSRAISELKLGSKRSSPEGCQSGEADDTSPVRHQRLITMDMYSADSANRSVTI